MTEGVAVPVELHLSGTTMRGYRWPGDDAWIVLLHEVGEDLDVWNDIPATLAAAGYTVVAIDLPGHGLSDDPWRPECASSLVDDIVRSVTPPTGRCFVIAAGSLSEPAMRSAHVDAIVALSPGIPSGDPFVRTPPALILVGGADTAAAEAADLVFRATRGWTVVSSFGSTRQREALYSGPWGPHALEQTLAFFRDYR